MDIQDSGDLLKNAVKSNASSIASGSVSGDSDAGTSVNSIDPPVLVYHENARSIVFRDHVRRAAANADKQQQMQSERLDNFSSEHDKIPTARRHTTTALLTEIYDAKKDMTEEPTKIIAGFQPTIRPLPPLELGPSDQFEGILQSPDVWDVYNYNPTSANTRKETPIIPKEWTVAEQDVVQRLQNQQAVVKTIKNTDWTDFLRRFHFSKSKHPFPPEHLDIASHDNFPFNSFITSTSLLPRGGKKMRCFGSPTLYTSGVVFALPTSSIGDEETEDELAKKTKTWSWPSGYAAKTEFNIDSHGFLINGREEAMEPFSRLRQMNDDYVSKEDYVVNRRLVKGGLKEVPYNEIFLRVGGLGRIVQNGDSNDENGNDGDNEENNECETRTSIRRSFEKGVGLPIALFVRMPTFAHLISLLRTRARLSHVLGENHIGNSIPLLVITPDLGVRVLTEPLQRQLLTIASRNLNPFQNPVIAHKTKMGSTSEMEFEQKLEELIDLDDSIRKMLTPEECARIAGGFGATDDSVASILKDAMCADKAVQKKNDNKENSADNGNNAGHQLQDIVNEGLAAAVRSGDYYTSRQLLILYTLVASMDGPEDTSENDGMDDVDAAQNGHANNESEKKKASSLGGNVRELQALRGGRGDISVATMRNWKPPPPPPLDTDRLRSATNSDGLLSVLGAAQVLRAMQDGSAKQRTLESVLAVEEWVEHGEQSMAFRVASWFDQRAAQHDLKIAMQNETSFLAFVSNKAISNRRAFAKQLRSTIDNTDFTDIRFLEAIYAMVKRMHSPCLRLELMQYVLGLDNRYSVAHVARSVELAATCMGISNTN